MTIVTPNDFRAGMLIVVENEIYSIIDYLHVRSGKGGAFKRTKMKNVRTGQVLEMTFRTEEKIKKADVEEKVMQFLYKAGEEYVFMDKETYDQSTYGEDLLGDVVKGLKEGLEVTFSVYEGRVLGVQTPIFVELKITETVPGVKGDSVTRKMKPATVETGASIMVPLFVDSGDRIKVDTRTWEYVERA